MSRFVDQLRQVVKNHPGFCNGFLLVCSILLTLFVLELALRFSLHYLKPDSAKKLQRYMNLARKDQGLYRFKPHPYLSYVRGDTVYKEGGIRIGEAFYPFEKPADVIRIACLGGSTTMNKYPLFMKEDLLRYDDAHSYEVMDFGCDGWTSTESVINYVIRVADFKPDFLLVHHGVNDQPPRVWPDFQPDYAHFRKPWGNQAPQWLRSLSKYSVMAAFFMDRMGYFNFDLQNHVIRRQPQDSIKKVPPPGTLEPFKRNLRNLFTLTKATDTQLIFAPMAYVGKYESTRFLKQVEAQNQCIRGIAKEYHVPLAETHKWLKDHEEWFEDSVHLAPQGDRLKSNVFAKVIWQLKQDNYDYKLKGQIQRHIEIQWDCQETDVYDFHIWVSANNQKPVFLGSTKSGEQHILQWNKKNDAVHPQFQNGPMFGYDYTFHVYGLRTAEPSRIRIPEANIEVIEK